MSAPLLMSVSGVRGIVGSSLTADVARRYAAAWGTLVRERSGVAEPTVCLGRDSRPSGEMLERAAIEGLADAGCGAVCLGIVATPSVAVMIEELGADGGLVVTASHNPLPWNGLKCLGRDGAAPGPADVQAIVERYERGAAPRPRGGSAPAARRDDSTHRRHVERVLASIDPAPVRARRFRVVLDSVNGAGGAAGRMLLESLGCEVIQMNGEPTGDFAHPPEPLVENLGDLCRRTAEARAPVGFAQDPDADRLAIVDERGRYIGEECTLALAARWVLERRGPGVLVANLSTSRMIDDIAAACAGARVVRSPVGEANVAAAMRASGALLGGEGNGGVIFPPVRFVRDSLSAMAITLDLLAAAGRPLSGLVSGLPRYEMVKEKRDLAALGGPGAVPQVIGRVAAAFRAERQSRADGLRIDFERGWVHLRPSNTEPIVRLIAEARSAEEARSLLSAVAVAGGL